MRGKFSFAAGALLSAVLAVLAAGESAVAQVVPLAPQRTAEAGDLLRQGQQLELERRWGEAFTFYEDALRRFPDDGAIRLRFDFTRLHYDVGRRYSDSSYGGMLGHLSLDEALGLYDELLLKIQAHYVQAPHWKELVERGTNSLVVALGEPVFLRRQAVQVDEKAISEFRGQLRGRLGAMVVSTRDDARHAVSLAAAMAVGRLGLSPVAVAMEYACGAANALDAYSGYLTPDQLSEVYSQINGNFVGLGVELKAAEGALLIVRVIMGSPAERAGLLGGDRILAVDGQSTRAVSTEQAADLLRGDAGSLVQLTVQIPGLEPREVVVRRDQVDVPSVDQVAMLDSGHRVGYLRLTCFQKSTARDLNEALWSLHRQGMQSLIVDLRGNPGGLLVTAVEVADQFVDRGVIVSTRGRNVQEDLTYTAHALGTWRVPLVVLIDQHSASAAEIVAGAVRDHGRGVLVGERSYGKGSVQGIFALGATSAGVRLTTARFYSPNGRPYSGVGVEPDLVVHTVARQAYQLELPALPIAAPHADPVLATALETARQLAAER